MDLILPSDLKTDIVDHAAEAIWKPEVHGFRKFPLPAEVPITKDIYLNRPSFRSMVGSRCNPRFSPER